MITKTIEKGEMIYVFYDYDKEPVEERCGKE